MTLNRSKSLLITIVFLVLAIACYTVGFALPGTVFLVIGAGAELAFWWRVFRGR